MSVVNVVRYQVGQSATPANNYTIRAMDDGALRVSRGNAGAEVAEILVGNADNTFTTLASPAQFDNGLRLATTEFVQRALGNMAGYGGLLNATQPIAQTSVGKFFTVSGAVTISLPAPAAALAGATIELIGVDPVNNYSVNVTGGSNISAYSGFAAATYAGLRGSPTTFRCTGSTWQVVQGAERYRGDWANSGLTNGYQKMPSGIIVQWGVGTAFQAPGANGVSFPIAFPTNMFALTIGNANGSGDSFSATSVGLTGFNFQHSSSGSANAFFMAIGN